MSETFQAMMFGGDPVPLTRSQADSPARTSQRRAPAKGSTEPAADSGGSSTGSSANFDHAGLLLRTCLLYELEALTGCSATWRRQATPAGRAWWVLRMSGRTTSGSESGSLLGPTPTVCGNNNRKGVSKSSGDGLATAVRQSRVLGPTPTANPFEIADVPRMLERRAKYDGIYGNGNGFGLTIGQAVKLAEHLGPTPKASDGRSRGEAGKRKNPGLPVVVRACTPTANDAKNDTLPPAIAKMDTLAGDLRRLSDSHCPPPDPIPSDSTNGSRTGSPPPRLSAVWVAEYMGLPTAIGRGLIAALCGFWATVSSGRSRSPSRGRSTESKE